MITTHTIAGSSASVMTKFCELRLLLLYKKAKKTPMIRETAMQSRNCSTVMEVELPSKTL
jgi:hypothetical protein